MKSKWHSTPGGFLRALIAIALLASATQVEGTLSIIMIGLGLLILVSGWVATIRNISKKERDEENDKRHS